MTITSVLNRLAFVTKTNDDDWTFVQSLEINGGVDHEFTSNFGPDVAVVNVMDGEITVVVDDKVYG